MAEEKPEKKNRFFAALRMTGRIFKWIGLGALALLLVASVIFQAPWKVITLLVIVLLACTALPKSYRKWFWLSAGAVVIALIIWVFLPDRDGDWRPYTFDKELAALEAKRAIPDSENAATIYKQLLESYDANAFEPNFVDEDCYDVTRSEPWSSKDYPQIAEWLKEQQPLIDTLLQASRFEKCRFPIIANTAEMSKQIGRLIPMRRWAYLLIRAANNDIGKGRTNQAIEKQIAVLQMAKHQYQQPTLIDMLVGIAIEALAIKQFNTFVVDGDATESHLSVIEKALAEIKHDWSYDLLRILEGEKLMVKNMICNLAYETNPKGKTRLSRDPLAAMRAQFPEELPPLTYQQRKLAKAGTILGWFGMPSTPQKAGEIIDESFEKYYAMAEPNFDWQKKLGKLQSFLTKRNFNRIRFNFRFLTELLGGMSEESYHRIHDLYLRVISDQRGSQILIALRRYKNKNGHWPESLDDIQSFAPAEVFIDPQNDGAFVYKLTEENFTLHSKGKNNIDENGEYNSTWDPNSYEYKVEEDDWLIWPPRGRKPKTNDENADPNQPDTSTEPTQ